MSKVYCKSCKHFDTLKYQGAHDKIEFPDGSNSIYTNTPLCYHETTFKKTIESTPVDSYVVSLTVVKDPLLLNKDNDCKFYTEQISFWKKLKNKIGEKLSE